MAARAEIRRLNTLHRGVTGPVRDEAAAARFGSAYQARDPGLSLWVHATLVDSTLATVDAWLEPLPAARRAAFYAETLPIARLLGIPDAVLPRDIAGFDDYMASMIGTGGPVHPTAVARDLASVILRPPLAPLARRGPVADVLGRLAAPAGVALALVPGEALGWLLIPGIGLLPPTLREEYGLPWGARERAFDAWLVTSWRAWMPLLPTSLRWFPQALAADARTVRRVARAG